MELPDFSNYVGVDEGDIEVVAELADKEIVSEIKSTNEQDDLEIESESELETEVADVSAVRARRAINCLKRYIMKNDNFKDISDEFMTAAGKVDKFLMFTRIHKSVQAKITDYFI